MLRTNLSTRPFYNVRGVRATLVAAGALVLALTLFNIVQITRLGMSQQTLGASAANAEEEAARLRGDAVKIRSQINSQELDVIANAAREANRIIDQRAFSWTELFAQFEATLPPDVRITAVQPRLGSENDFVVAIAVQSRRAEDLDTFIEALENAGAFHNVLAVKEQTSPEGLIEAIVEGTYTARPRGVGTGASASAPTSGSGDRP